jgi:hypothetical protein
VDNFLSIADPDDTTLVALDFEETEGNQMTLDQARQFLTSVGDELSRKPVLYCGGLFKSEMGNTVDEFFGSHRLWLAQYGANPVAQASWDTYWLWQYTNSLTGLGPNKVDGIPGDANVAGPMFWVDCRLTLPPVKPLRSTGLHEYCPRAGSVNNMRDAATKNSDFIAPSGRGPLQAGRGERALSG